ncbi:hypothetical protein [Neoroseomonas soli]|uniref:Peptidase inhibitor I78 family protein n=1 Tax=Neoroseomonas soli TaxID=1081025 RepID=A0A9X9WWH0_9PROT|nr:hypothetical protein [Neoroseomonas soli]MBR0671499.1 hypothetical protein [Neoroseomonas soli]
MNRLAAAVLLLSVATACAQPAEGCLRHQAGFAALIGGSPEAARAALERMPGIRSVRVGGPDTPMTRDYRPDRATVLVEGGVVRSITCG